MTSSNYQKFFIDGAWVDPISDETLDVENPATEQVFATIALGTSEDVDKAVAAARAAFDSWSTTSVEERLAVLRRIEVEYKKRYDDIAVAISSEMGAPMNLAKTAQAGSGLGNLKNAISVLENYAFQEDKGDVLLIREAIGVVGMITPWNWPINQVVAKVAPALAAGCTMVLKPTEIAPVNALIFAEIMEAAEVPKGVFNLVNGTGPVVGAAISRHPDIDMVTFTGSTRAGVDVATGAAPTVKRVTQELGGKSPNIILEHSGFDKAVKAGAISCFHNTGQTCIAPTRMLVPKTRMADAAGIAAKAAEETNVGDPLDENTFMGPLSSRMQWDKVQGLIETGMEEGANLAAGGTGKPDGLNAGHFVKPTVFTDVSNDMTIAREEIFGPVLSIIGYEDEEDAIAIANDTPYGLFGYVSGDPEDAKRVGARIRAGAVRINGAAGHDFPFGGYKQSGNGREHGVFGLEEFLEVKAILT